MILPLKRYAQFEGRANRREYWMYQLFLFLVATAVMLLAGVLATCGNMVPSLTLCLLAVVFIERFRNNYWLQRALTGVRPVCVGLMAATAVLLFQENYFSAAGDFSFKSLVIGLASLYLLVGRKWGTIKVIGVAAVLGILLPTF